MTRHQKKIATMTTLDPHHVEVLAIAAYSTLDGLPDAAFRAVVDAAEAWGPEKLEAFIRREMPGHLT